MMYNVPEQETKDIEERNKQEFQCVGDFITKGIKIGSLNIKHVNRMGRYVKERKDKPRPMRVTFTENNSLLWIFRNVSNLKDAEEKYHRISIQRELSKEEMEASHSKIDEAKEKNKARMDKSTYLVVRGLPSKWEIKSIPAKPDGQGSV